MKDVGNNAKSKNHEYCGLMIDMDLDMAFDKEEQINNKG